MSRSFFYYAPNAPFRLPPMSLLPYSIRPYIVLSPLIIPVFIFNLYQFLQQTNIISIKIATLLYTNFALIISTFVTILSVIYLIPELFLISRVFGSFVTNINFCAFTVFVTEFPATKFRGLAVFLGGFNANIVQNVGMLLGWFLGKNLVYLTGKKVIKVKKYFLLILKE
ncbi:unnamed protein product [Meloidogyne enterolobii]|uniref:Uncharacterized protein n=1 Tax=Meloidogyne enterolobii TaxID=390850 RepID=A0ACB1AG78_MELEN